MSTHPETGSTTLQRTIGLPSAIALYCGAVLGTGILVLPAVAAETAGPASLVAWIALCVLSLPMALTFATLARREPVAGGFSAYVVRAFGKRVGAIAGWLFLAQVPTGSVVASLISASYLGAAFGFGREGVFLLAGVVLLLAYGLNYFGLRIAGAAQLVATLGVLALVGVVLVASFPRVRIEEFHPFAPLGWSPVGVAAAQLFWAFVGWEAITPLAEEFRDPERDLIRASVISVAIVGVLYVALAWVTLGTHAYGHAHSELPPFVELGSRVFGSGAVTVVGVAGGLLCLLPINAYVAGTSRLAWALAREGDFPRWFGVLHPSARLPRRALVALGVSCLVALAISYGRHYEISHLLPLSTSSFLATYVLSMAAALRLLKGAGAVLAAVSLAGCLVILACVGAVAIWLVAVSLACLLYGSLTRRASSAPSAAAGLKA